MPLFVTSLALTGAVAFARPISTPSTTGHSGWHPVAPRTADRTADHTADRTASPDSLDALRRGERYARWMVDGPADSLLAAMTPEAAARIGGVAGLDERRAAIRRDLGTPVSVVRQSVELAPDARVYVRVGRFSEVTDALVRIELRLDASGRIISGELAVIAEDGEPDGAAAD